VFRPNACLGTGLSKPPKTFVTVALDHMYSVCTHYTMGQVSGIGC
jgi:hypothetical protein